MCELCGFYWEVSSKFIEILYGTQQEEMVIKDVCRNKKKTVRREYN